MGDSAGDFLIQNTTFLSPPFHKMHPTHPHTHPFHQLLKWSLHYSVIHLPSQISLLLYVLQSLFIFTWNKKNKTKQNLLSNITCIAKCLSLKSEEWYRSLGHQATWSVALLPHHRSAFPADTLEVFFWGWRLFYCIEKNIFPLSTFPRFSPPIHLPLLPPAQSHPHLCFFCGVAKSAFWIGLFSQSLASDSKLLEFQIEPKL